MHLLKKMLRYSNRSIRAIIIAIWIFNMMESFIIITMFIYFLGQTEEKDE